jgi:hypothetical protein
LVTSYYRESPTPLTQRETATLWKGEADGVTYENTLREQGKQRR